MIAVSPTAELAIVIITVAVLAGLVVSWAIKKHPNPPGTYFYYDTDEHEVKVEPRDCTCEYKFDSILGWFVIQNSDEACPAHPAHR